MDTSESCVESGKDIEEIWMENVTIKASALMDAFYLCAPI